MTKTVVPYGDILCFIEGASLFTAVLLFASLYEKQRSFVVIF